MIQPPAEESSDAAARENSEEEFRLFFELAAVGATQVDPVTRKFLRANARFTAMIGYTEAELRELTFFDLTAPEDIDASRRMFDETISGQRREFALEQRLRRKDGSLVWVSLSVAIVVDKRGQPVRAMAVVQNITARKRAEGSVRANEQRLSAIFSAAAAGLCEITLDGRFERVNDELCRMLGRSRELLLESNVLEVTFPDDVVATLRAISRLLETGERVSLDKRYVRSDGEILWANSMLTRLDDENGRPRAILKVTVDLTVRRAVERALEESEAKFRMLADASPAVIWFVDPRGEIRYVNRRYLEFFGKTEREVFGDTLRPEVHPDDSTEYAAEMANAVRERRPVTFRARVRRHDGAWRWIEAQALPHFGEDDRYLGHVGHSLDITDMLEATEAVRRSEERLRRATEIETVGIVFFNLSGLITEANDAFLRMSGYTRQDVQEHRVRIDAMTPPEWRARTNKAMDELAALGRTMPYEKKYLRRDGSQWWGLFAATRLSPDEGVEFVIDITERKDAESELQGYHEELEERVLHRTAELDQLNGSLRDEVLERRRTERARQELLRQLVSAQEDERRRISRELHDQVGQDLTALMLGLKSLQSNPPMPEVLHRLQLLTQNIGKQIHDLALEIRPTALDDLGLVRTLSNYVEEWSKRTGVAVDFHSSGLEGVRLPSHLETTLYRIVREALNNVLKHAEARCVSLILEQQSGHAVAIIEDDGKGFDLDTQAAGSKRLGIVGMRERAALAGGEVILESSPGDGTTVFVRMPLHPNLHKDQHV